MILESKFNKFYILRIALIPILCFGLSILFICIKIYYKKDINVIYTILFLLIIGSIVLFYNLNTFYKIIVEEKSITKIFFLSKEKEIIPYSNIKSSSLNFVKGVQTDAGIINPGYYKCIFILENEQKLILSPLYYENYNDLIRAINNNRSE